MPIKTNIVQLDFPEIPPADQRGYVKRDELVSWWEKAKLVIIRQFEIHSDEIDQKQSKQ